MCVRWATRPLLGPLAGSVRAMDKLIELAVSVVSGGLVALLTWWLTTRSRDRQDEQRQREALRGHADALVVAVSDLRAAYVVNRMLWERWPEILRTVALTAIAVLGVRPGPVLPAGRTCKVLWWVRGVGRNCSHRKGSWASRL